MHSLILCIIIAVLARQSVTLKTFDPQCTHPEESVHVVNSPDARGTLDILWVTLPALLLCTWTVQHPNVPVKRPNESSHNGTLRGILEQEWANIMWMVITIVAPEIIIGFAFQDWMLARRFFEILDLNGNRQNTTWKKRHVFFANMGGFVLTLKKKQDQDLFYNDESMLETLERVSKIEQNWQRSSLSHAWFLKTRLEQILYKGKQKTSIQSLVQATNSFAHRKPNKDGRREVHPGPLDPASTNLAPSKPIELQPVQSYSQGFQSASSDIGITKDTREIRPAYARDTISPIPIPKTQQNAVIIDNSMRQRESLESESSGTEDVVLYLNAIQLYVAMQIGIIKQLPQYDEQTILNLSKSSAGVKVYALAQVGVFLYRIIKRYAKQLPISQLEMAVFAFCLCCCCAYCFYWSKPQSVMEPIDIPKGAGDPPRPVLEVDINLLRCFGSTNFMKTTFVPPFSTVKREPTSPIGNEAMDGVFFLNGGVQTHYAEFAAVFTGVIFGALYFMAWSFPFPSKVESLMWKISTSLTAGGPLLYAIANNIMTGHDKGGIRQTIILYSVVIFYLVARLFLIVEMFRTLRFLPTSAFAA
jgi:hypothetical protein